MFSFNFNGKDSYEDYGIKIKDRPSNFLPERNVYQPSVEGRSGNLTIDYGTYKSGTLPIKCLLINGEDYQSTFREIKKWLSSGLKDLYFSDEPGRIYKAICVNKIDFEQAYHNFGEFVVVFDVQPLTSDVSDTITLIAPSTIYGPDELAESKPVIKVYGSGSIDLTINGEEINLANVVDYVTIDSDLADCYKDTVLKNNYMSGEFPELLPGENTISWTGTVTKVEVTPNWRYL